MPLEPPNLDDRDYDQIRQELLLRIPNYAPEWTDWNESDPGATLIDLFAWLAESIGYRLNKWPERGLLTFLAALGIVPDPARPARADLTFTVRDKQSSPITVPVHTPVAAQARTPDGPIVFETEQGVELIPLRLRRIQVGGLSGFESIAVDEAGYPPFRPFGGDPQHGNALYLGFGPADGPVVFPQQIRLLVDPAQDRQPTVSGVRLQWEYRSAGGGDRWSPLGTADDGSEAFTRHGYVLIDGPRDSAAVAGVGLEDRPMHWLRCRFADGQYPSGQEPVLDLLRYNTTPALSVTSVTDELAAQSDGRTGQVVSLRFRPVLPQTVQVDVVDPAAAEPTAEDRWQRVADLIDAGPQDQVFTVDGSRGRLSFGDGRNGKVPVAGHDVRVSYRWGGTALANVAKDTITGLQSAAPGVESVTNQRPAVDGADEQSAQDLSRRAPAKLRSRDRAVTTEDYRELATRVGGVADAVALELHHPDYPGIQVPGCVTVVVLATSQDRLPTASPELIDAVRQQLDPARTVGTELHVTGARFREAAVTVKIEVSPDASIGEVREQAQAAIDKALSPGSGRFGQPFFPTSLFGVLQQIPDVLAVPLLEVRIDGNLQSNAASAAIEADQLIVPAAQHDITIRPRADR